MERYHNNIQDQFGNALSSVTVTVRRVSDGGVASIFSDNSGTGKSNPFTNDADGEFFFYAANDRYDIFFTGPITDQKDDVLLFDHTGVNAIDVFADIVTATPPTTETPFAMFQIFDLDGTDRLAFLGFNTENNLQIRNQMHGGGINLTAENTAGTARQIMGGDPDGAANMYHAGIVRARTNVTGVFQIFGDGSADTDIRRLDLIHQDGTLRARFGHFGASGLFIRNDILGGSVTIDAEDSGDVLRTILTGDPDGAASIYYNGVKTLEAASQGRAVIFGDLNSDVDERELRFAHADGTVRGRIGHFVGSDFTFKSEIHGGIVILSGEDTGTVERFFLVGDPDAITSLRGDTNVQIEVAAGELAIECIANSVVVLYTDNIERFRTTSETLADQISGARVLNAAGVYKPVGLGVIEDDATAFGSGAQTPFQQINAHETIENNETVATSYTTFASTGGSQTNIPAGAQWEVKNTNTGALTILGGSAVTLTWFDGAGAAAPTGTRTLARAGRCIVRKISDTNYEIWGVGLT